MSSPRILSTRPYRSNQRRSASALFAAAALAVSASTAVAQESFTWNGGSGTGKDWELSTNWTGGSGFASQYPGDTAVDSANLSVALGGNLGVVFDAKSITLGTLTLGATDGAFDTTISAGGPFTLTASTFVTNGATGATNNINANFVMPNGNVEFLAGGTNALTINGSLLNNAPVAGTFRDIRNESGQTLTINGDVVLSDTAGTSGNLRFRNNATATETVINGVISDGAATGGDVRYARGTFHIMGANTYTGGTQLGENSPNAPATHVIYTDSAFGTDRIVSSGGSALKTIEGAAGMGTRTIDNEIQISQVLGFAGTESIVLNGQLFQSNSRSLTNNISGAGKTLTLNGPVFAANSSDNRTFTFTGSGTTVVNGVIDDTTSIFGATGSLRKDGTGRLILTNPGGAAYGGATEVFNGTLQLGTGGSPVNLPATILGGGTATTGTLEINHNGAMSLDAKPTYQVGIRHAGPGRTELSQTSFATGGTVDVDAGTLIINGQNFAGSAVSNALKVDGKTLQVPDTSGLTVGQPLAATGSGDLVVQPGTYITAILSGTHVEVNNTMFGPSGTATNDIAFSSGSGTGSSNVIVDAGATVGGNGTIGGLLGVNGTVSPGEGIGTLTGNANAVVNGTLLAEYDGSGAGSSDLLDVLGALTLGASSTLDLNQLGLPADDAAYVIASYGSLSGTFANVLDLPAGYTIDYSYNDGFSSNNIAIAVPEPAGVALLGLSGLALLSRRRTRRSA
ncbi:MAG TPA: PEP-CTERM sorting domain-containing protein [Tepidisphaeraceae bacterium]|nr:PEP-CTERM sorting domain-containing protein [Tepidisphaeraceae bacterium]